MNSIKRVQLWEGGPYWADRNIGAENPWDSGYYFWWGDTVGYERKNGKWVASDGSNTNYSFDENTPTHDRDCYELQNDGWISADGVLVPQHDAAQKHLGGDWRMPTVGEFEDLISKCDWKWVEQNAVEGYIVQGKGSYASESIFLPCAGFGVGTSLLCADSFGGYMSSVPYSGYGDCYEWNLYFCSGDHGTSNSDRYYGASVRPLQGGSK
jgi:hypothetical protein